MTEPLDPAAEHERLKTVNAERLKAIGAQGVPVSLIPNYLDHLTETLIPDKDELIRFRLGWEQKCSALLDELESQIAKARLLQGVPGVN